jgi:hypothetical protein
MTRVFLAGLLGGIAMFIWTHLAYTVLPLGDTGIRDLPHETAVLSALQNNIGEKSGVYLFPGPRPRSNLTNQQEAEAMTHLAENVARYPSGILMYSAAGSRPADPSRRLTVELVTELTEAILAVCLLSRTQVQKFGARVGFIFAIGIIVAIGSNVPYWNWYGFSTSYISSYMLIQMIGFLCVGLVAALMLKSQALPVLWRPWFLRGLSRAMLSR